MEEQRKRKEAEMLTADFKPGVSTFLRLGKALRHARLTPVFALAVSGTTASQHCYTCRMQEGRSEGHDGDTFSNAKLPIGYTTRRHSTTSGC